MEEGGFKRHLFEKDGIIYYNLRLKPQARDLRKNMTDAEKLLWSRIRRRQLKNMQFYRQRIIDDYIVDFYCPKAKLAIELDGRQHGEEDMRVNDTVRDHYLTLLGIQVLRISNREIFEDLNGILGNILERL